MDQRELDKILWEHKKWLERPDDWSDEGVANLTAADLHGTDLHGAELFGANLFAADLQGATLQGTKLCDANLCSADLRGADLRGANLYGAVLWEADLRNADLWGSNLRGANLLDADLRGADLQGASLRNANLQGANLLGADIGQADMYEIKTDTATKIDWPMVCPETGSFVAWKKAGEYIVKLEIPEDAKRSSATTSKCRASMAKVLEIQNEDGTRANKADVRSSRGKTYKIGEIVYPDKWDNNRWNECSHGIHFFMTRQEAVEW